MARKAFYWRTFQFSGWEKGCGNAAAVCPAAEMCRIAPMQTVNPVLALGVLGPWTAAVPGRGAEDEQNLLLHIHIYIQKYMDVQIHTKQTAPSSFMGSFPKYFSLLSRIFKKYKLTQNLKRMSEWPVRYWLFISTDSPSWSCSAGPTIICLATADRITGKGWLDGQETHNFLLIWSSNLVIFSFITFSEEEGRWWVGERRTGNSEDKSKKRWYII